MAFSMLLLGQRLRKARRARDFTQQALQEHCGVHYTTIARIESGQWKQVYAETIYQLAESLQVSADWLLGLSDEVDLESEIAPAGVGMAGT